MKTSNICPLLISLRCLSSFKNNYYKITHLNDLHLLLFQHQRALTSQSTTDTPKQDILRISDRRNEDNNTVENAVAINESKMHAPSAHKESVWESFFVTPYKWYDLRMNKRNQSVPDFQHVDTRKALWIKHYKTPDWVITRLSNLGKKAFAPSSTQNLWEMLFADPSKWVDNRKIKKSNKHPDFVHKFTHEGLWAVDVKTPSWVIPTLKNLEDEAFTTSPTMENLWKIFLANPSRWFDNRQNKRTKRHPDFTHKDTDEALWIDSSDTPTWVIPKLKNVKDRAFAPSQTMENLWKHLFTSPSSWFDNRKSKKTNRHPDFTHKDTSEALWIDNLETPVWVKPMLDSLKDEKLSHPSIEELWKIFFADPSKWVDNRKAKKSNKHPDFVHKGTYEALWVDSSKTPAWVLSEFNVLCDESFSQFPSLESLWKNFFADPTKWFDKRETKRSRKSPDFIQVHTGKGLWVEGSSTPSWVAIKLNELPKCKVHFDDLETPWNALFANPSKWFDERMTKKTPRDPDFRNKETRKVLWINRKSTPAWVISSLSKLENEAFASPSTERMSDFLFVDPSFMLGIDNEQKDDSGPEFTLKGSQEKGSINF